MVISTVVVMVIFFNDPQLFIQTVNIVSGVPISRCYDTIVTDSVP